MSYQELRDGRHVARNDHRCEGCGLIIAKGSEYARRVYKWEGDLNDEKLHTWCRGELNLFLDDGLGDDGFDWYEVNEFIGEMLHDYGYGPQEEADHE